MSYTIVGIKSPNSDTFWVTNALQLTEVRDSFSSIYNSKGVTTYTYVMPTIV